VIKARRPLQGSCCNPYLDVELIDGKSGVKGLGLLAVREEAEALEGERQAELREEAGAVRRRLEGLEQKDGQRWVRLDFSTTTSVSSLLTRPSFNAGAFGTGLFRRGFSELS
jgi:hypothetical protein